MTRHVSDEQVRHWFDENVVQNVTRHGGENVAFNFELELSRLPIHVIKEDVWGPVRIVGRSGFDTAQSRALLRDDRTRGELLRYVGPMLAATPGFYTFLDEDGRACPLRRAEILQVEYRIYPDEASQQALMDAVMAIGTSMRYVQNVVAAINVEDERGGGDGDEDEEEDEDGDNGNNGDGNENQDGTDQREDDEREADDETE